MPRSMFSLTASALSAVPSLNFRPGRRVNVMLLPFDAYFHDSARPGSTLPAGSRLVIDAYTRPRACTSQPSVDVTGSQELGSSHSQFSVPLAPSVLAVLALDVPAPLLQAVASTSGTAVARTAASRRRRFFLRLVDIN